MIKTPCGSERVFSRQINLNKSYAFPGKPVSHHWQQDVLYNFVIPVLLLWDIFYQISSWQEALFPHQSVIFTYLNYLAVVLHVYLLFYALRRWFKSSHPYIRASIITAFVFFIGYTFGIQLAYFVPGFDVVRRNLVGNLIPASFVLILLLVPISYWQMRVRVLWLVVGVASIGSVFAIFFQDLSYLEIGRASGLFDQSSVSAGWIVSGTFVLLTQRNLLRIPSLLVLILLLLFSLALLYLGSILAILLACTTYFSFVVFAIKDIRLRIGVVLICAAVFVAYITFIWVPSENTEYTVINYRTTALLNAIQTGDSAYIYNTTTIEARWNATTGALKDLPDYFFRGKGLDQDAIQVTYYTNREINKLLDVHNAILGTWLQAGGIAALMYLLFLFMLFRLYWHQASLLNKPGLGLASIAMIMLGLVSVTGIFDSTIWPLFIASSCILFYSPAKPVPSLPSG
ncbi:MAG: hypothetical protein ACOYYS_27605 [Chloroflexota bacterium]